jgi:hypothetical protein
MSFPQFVMVACAIVVATMAGAIFVRQRLPAAAIAIAGAMAVTAVNAAGYLRHYADDAYITLRYARYFAAGQGPVWNPGERVEGYTDFLWMALIAALHRLGADLVEPRCGCRTCRCWRCSSSRGGSRRCGRTRREASWRSRWCSP